MVDPRHKTLGLRIAAGFAVAAVGVTALFQGRRKDGKPVPSPAESFETGRGRSDGPVNAPSLEAGYEVEDTNIRALAIVMVVSVAIMVFGVAVVFWMYARFDRTYASASIGMTVEQRAPIVPPLPHLQAFPYRDIDAMIMEQKRRLATYGLDGGPGSQAHIPIERAMRQVVGRSLDPTASADAAGAPGTTRAMPLLPNYNAAIPQDKPANRVQGEGRPGAVAPSYAPTPDTGTKP